MLLYPIAVLFLVLQNSSGFKINVDDVPDPCRKGHIYMAYRLRRIFLEGHNAKRASLAEGEVEIEGGIKLPGAANMQFMAYNCSLEERATELTERCERLPDRTKFSKRRRNFADFDYTISNGPISVAKEAVEKWWNQKPKWQELQNISENDYSAIPFFLMAQAEIDQIGCSVSLCKKDGESSYYTVGCVYGKRVKSDSELYQKGPACSTCEKNCYKNVLCKKP